MRMRELTGLALLAAAAMGCGEVVGPPVGGDDDPVDVDAQPIDAEPIDADLTGTLTVTTRNHVRGGTADALIEGVQLVALRPDDSVSGTATTSAAGTAELDVWPGGSVTAIYPHTVDQGADLVTYVGVEPGDHLQLGRRVPPESNGTQIGSMTVSFSAPAGPTHFYVFAPCGTWSSSTSPITFYAYDGCHRSSMDLLVLGYNSGTSNYTHYTYANNVTWTTGGNVAFGGLSTMTNATLSANGLPPEATYVDMYLYQVVDGDRLGFNTYGGGALTGNAFTAARPWAFGGDRLVGRTYIGRSGNYHSIQVHDSIPSIGQPQYTVANPMLPPWNGGWIASSEARRVEWIAVGGSAHDATVIRLRWSRANSIAHGGPTQSEFQWYIVLPPGMMSFELPALPSNLESYLPRPEEYIDPAVAHLEYPAIPDYDALRDMPEKDVVCGECAVNEGVIQRYMMSGYLPAF